MNSLIMVAALLICFTAAVLNLAMESRFRQTVTRFAIIGAVCIGSVFYGSGYAHTQGLHLTSLLRALLALCRMFGGVNDLSAVQAAPVFQLPGAMTVFWLGHFLAFYVTASTAIATLGARLLRRIRITLLRRGPLLLIYGVNAHSVSFGRRMAREKHRSVLYVDQEYNTVFDAAVNSFGAVIEKGTDALNATPRFLRQINMKPGNRKLELAVLHTDTRKNMDYAQALLASLTARGIHPDQTSLLAAGAGGEVAAMQAMSGDGYGSVHAFDEYELTARLMIRKVPPCDLVSFGPDGKAAEDFHAVILGFGRMGRAVLTQLVMNGQFHGSHFRVDIFDPGAQNGFLHDHPLMKHYDIRFHQEDGSADCFYSFLEENRASLRMIILCTGSREKNHELAGDLAGWSVWESHPPLIVHATKEKVYWLEPDGKESESAHIYDSDGLDIDLMDAMAMEVNHIYCVAAGSLLSAREEWRRCGYENRQSSRACADFYPAFLRAAGKTREQVLAGDWPPPEQVLENCAVTEHLRWCAYHYAIGYSPMPEAVWRERAERYRQERAEGHMPKDKIGKDPLRKLQACLIPWEELDDLSRRENDVTGGHVDYQQMDRNNVLMLSRVLAAIEKEQPHE
ncbi:MAG: hypothetical protein IJI21_04450 [Clostridia bacterium]|nr:hypothetical protein [Clostridia bacterium]